VDVALEWSSEGEAGPFCPLGVGLVEEVVDEVDAATPRMTWRASLLAEKRHTT